LYIVVSSYTSPSKGNGFTALLISLDLSL